MKSPVVKRSILLSGHKTSVSLEEAFWQGLKEIASDRKMSVSALIGTIDNGRTEGNLSSGIRLFVLDHFRALASQPATETAGRHEARGEAVLTHEAYRGISTLTPPAFRKSA